MHTTLLIALALLPLSACSGDGRVSPRPLDTFAYSEGGHQTVACCTSREEQLRTHESTEYSLKGVPWIDAGVFHDGEDPIACIKPEVRTPVRIGYILTEVTDDAPGSTLIAWLQCAAG